MLLVNTYLDKSDIEGIGLFASNSIKKGDIVWKYNEITTIKWADKQ